MTDPLGGELPHYTPGSHIEIKTPHGLYRHYSLIRDGKHPTAYELGIKRMSNGRGGSMEITNDLVIGQTIEVGYPENYFELETADEYLFIAGGIGITPILSMMEHLKQIGHTNYRLIYCTRSLGQTPYLDRIRTLIDPEKLIVHHDEGSASNQFDFWPYLAQPKQAHIYCCGPTPMMDDIRGMTGHWEEAYVHFEDFGSSQTNTPLSTAGNTAFEIKHAKTGRVYYVPEDKTILEALRAEDINLPSSCESGTCGTCLVRLVDGEADHRDFILDSKRQSTEILICVSRSHSPLLVLDW